MLLLSILTLSKAVDAQEKRTVIHFLVDTITVNRNNRIVEIGKEGPGSYYAFYCKCIEPYNSYVSFAYLTKESKTDTLAIKPDYNFLSWKDLSDILKKEGNDLSKKYFVLITELLPNNKYITHKVWLVTRRPPIIDQELIRGPK